VIKQFTRVASFALVLGLSATPALAQNGSNFNVLSNNFDVIYGGLGAGGGQVAGVDGFGVWVSGEIIRGNTLTTLGDFGYREANWRESLCVLGAPIPTLGLDFPVIVSVEMDGVNPYGAGNVFTYPACGTAGPFPLGNSAGFAPYGAPAGSSANFLLSGLPSGVGFPSATTVLLPNNGLVPSSNGGTATIIAAASSKLPIASTGFCWVVQFGWAPSALASLDDINGWWTWRTNGVDGNQYWGMSNDEMNVWQSNTVFTDGGQTGLIAFFSNLDYEYHSAAVNPVTNPALAPAGAAGTGLYYATGAGVPNSGSSGNGGFDLGRHTGLSLNGTGGTVNPNTGLGNQDPAGSPTPGIVPTLGFTTWNNATSTGGFHLTWIQVNNELTFGLDPAGNADALKVFGTVRVPVSISQIPGPFPQPITNLFFGFYIHGVADQTGQSGWLDPNGFAGGTFGVAPTVGASIHLPTVGPPAACIGFPVGLSAATSQLGGPAGPLVWGRNFDAPSNTSNISLLD
jgi:hypothetical protein